MNKMQIIEICKTTTSQRINTAIKAIYVKQIIEGKLPLTPNEKGKIKTAPGMGEYTEAEKQLANYLKEYSCMGNPGGSDLWDFITSQAAKLANEQNLEYTEDNYIELIAKLA